jgi:1-acyl-sn-glycerol-3-phosphate acyltransferase
VSDAAAIAGPPIWRYTVSRALLALTLRAYLRFRVEGAERLPAPPYLICFNHLGWLDPFVLMVAWPGRPRVHVFGPKEEDMRHGLRNRLISWVGTGVPFRPTKDDIVRSTRRALAVLRGGEILAIAGEGRLSEEEDVVLPLNEGAAFLAVRSRLPVVPVALNGTRWLRFGKTVRVRVGEPVAPSNGSARAEVPRITAALHGQLVALVGGYEDPGRPGTLGRWLTELFSERPWLTEEAATSATGHDAMPYHEPAASKGSDT